VDVAVLTGASGVRIPVLDAALVGVGLMVDEEVAAGVATDRMDVVVEALGFGTPEPSKLYNI
jgi:hypothetical protein